MSVKKSNSNSSQMNEVLNTTTNINMLDCSEEMYNLISTQIAWDSDP